MIFKYALSDRHGPLNIEDYRQAAARRLPRISWAFVESGADDLVTRRANESSFSKYRLRQRSLTGSSTPILATTMMGAEVKLPVALAPTGLAGLSHWSGDVGAVQGAESAGTRIALSTASSHSVEEVSAAARYNHWFQLYAQGDNTLVEWLMNRAAASGFESLLVTVDVPVRGNREGERRVGLDLSPIITPRRVLGMMRHPRWLWNTLVHKRHDPIHISQMMRAASSGEIVPASNRQMQADMNWNDIRWIRDRWKGRLYLKGILDADDAVVAVDEVGVTGVVVSNHGGRQLDRSLATIDALPAISDRIGNRAEVYLDGGVRRGTDVITAMCLGAKGVFIGRPYLYGLAVGGAKGVADVLRILRDEMTRDLILMGCPSVEALDRSWLIAPST